MSYTDPTKQLGVNQVLTKGGQFLLLIKNHKIIKIFPLREKNNIHCDNNSCYIWYTHRRLHQIVYSFVQNWFFFSGEIRYKQMVPVVNLI